jgi:hypothetical protein
MPNPICCQFALAGSFSYAVFAIDLACQAPLIGGAAHFSFGTQCHLMNGLSVANLAVH